MYELKKKKRRGCAKTGNTSSYTAMADLLSTAWPYCMYCPVLPNSQPVSVL